MTETTGLADPVFEQAPPGVAIPNACPPSDVARFVFAVHDTLLSAGLATLAVHGAASLAVKGGIAGAVVRVALVHMARPCPVGHVGRCAIRPRARNRTNLDRPVEAIA